MNMLSPISGEVGGTGGGGGRGEGRGGGGGGGGGGGEEEGREEEEAKLLRLVVLCITREKLNWPHPCTYSTGT